VEEPTNGGEIRHRKKRHKRPLAKIVFTIFAAVILFAAGVAIGRGDVVHVNRLSFERGVNGPSNELNYSSVDQVYDLLQKDFDGNLNKSALLDGAKSGLVSAAGDPYTQYFSPKDAKEFNNQLSGTIVGIGAELGTDADNNIVIVSPLSGYPAEKAGLKPKDIVAGIDGKATTGMSVDQVVKKIRGNENTKVTLTIVRGNGSPFNVDIVRQKITVPSVKWQVDGNIGYLKISQFTDDTQNLAQKAVTEFQSKGVKGVVLDLRGDPGGYLNTAVSVSSLWLDQGKTVVQERRGSTVVDTQTANGQC
jgi:carboxyl-terminal processing protease